MPHLDRLAVYSMFWLQLFMVFALYFLYIDGLLARVLVNLFCFFSFLQVALFCFFMCVTGFCVLFDGFCGFVTHTYCYLTLVFASLRYVLHFLLFSLGSLIFLLSPYFSTGIIGVKSLFMLFYVFFYQSVLQTFACILCCEQPVKYQFGFVDSWTTSFTGITHLYFDLMLILMMILWVVVLLLAVLLLNGFRFGLSNFRVHEASLISFLRLIRNSELEFVWTVVPIGILVLISFPIFGLIYSLGTVEELPDLIVHVVGSQWMWEIRYVFPSGFATSSMNVQPTKVDPTNMSYRRFDFRGAEVTRPIRVFVGQRVQFVCTSVDVVHSFAINGAGIKLDCTPGRVNTVVTRITRPGIFYGACYELCGTGHSLMPIVLHAYEQDV